MGMLLKTEELKDLYIGIAVVRYTLSFAIVTVNGGILLAFLIQSWRGRRQRPRRSLPPSGCFVINLLLADTLVGAMLFYALQFKLWPENAVHLAKRHYACLLRFALGFLSVCGSHNALLSVVIDRYIAVVHTMRYRDWMNSRTCALMLTASWIVPAIGWAYLFFFGNWQPNMPTCSESAIMANFALYVWLPLQIVLLLSIVVIQSCVHFELWRYGRTKSVTSSVLCRSTQKSARVMFISNTAFVLFYAPYDVAAMVFMFFPSASTRLIYNLCCIGTALTFLVNPCLYSFKTESVRRPVSELFSDLRKTLCSFTSKQEKTNQPASNGPTLENVPTMSSQTSSAFTLSTSLNV